jgi:hypothetical protein
MHVALKDDLGVAPAVVVGHVVGQAP